MCMHDVRKWKRGEKKPKFGYKVFQKTRDKNRLESHFGNTCYKKGKWYYAECDSGGKMCIPYSPGFHTFFSRYAASKYCKESNSAENTVLYTVRRVAVKKMQHRGRTYPIKDPASAPVFTSGAMKIL